MTHANMLCKQILKNHTIATQNQNRSINILFVRFECYDYRHDK